MNTPLAIGRITQLTTDEDIRAEAAAMIRQNVAEAKQEMQISYALACWNIDDLHDAMGDLVPTQKILDAVQQGDEAELGHILMRHFKDYAESQRGWKHD